MVVKAEVEVLVRVVVALAMSTLLNAMDLLRSSVSMQDQKNWLHSPVVSLIVLEFLHKSAGAVAFAVESPCIERKV